MKSYLIDPFAMTVTEVDHDGSLKSIYELLDCHTIDAVRPEGIQDVIYVDDDGLSGGPEQAFFYCEAYPHHSLAGKGLWVGTKRGGNDAPPKMPIEPVSVDGCAMIVGAATAM